MKTSVLVFNYNYERFVCEAVQSALDQTVQPDEVIVVDDGSIDNSRAKLDAAFGDDSRVKLIYKENEGQVAAFNDGFSSSSGDIIFFLDADDVYKLDYIERVLSIYELKSEVDFISVSYEYFGRKAGMVHLTSDDRDLGFSIIRGYYGGNWIGSATSMNSIRRVSASGLFPLPFAAYRGFHTHGDIAFVFGSSILGLRKYYLTDSYVFYRAHEENAELDQKHSQKREYIIRAITSRVQAYYWSVTGLPHHFINNLLLEFQTIEKPTRKDKKDYIRLIRLVPLSFFKKLRVIKRIMLT